MPSLTPMEHKDEVVSKAMMEGLTNGLLTMIPVGGLLAYGRTQPAFWKRTNWQSRTAMFVMPPLFVFAFTAETTIQTEMKELAARTEHTLATVRWAEKQIDSREQVEVETDPHLYEKQRQIELTQLYQYSLQQQQKDSSEKIIPGDELEWYHHAANYVVDNSVKVLLAVSIPSVGLIYWAQQSKQHLDFSRGLLHTRVIGQASVLVFFIGLMGFRDYMQKNGRFVTQAQVDARVEAIHKMRERLQERLQKEREHKREIEAEIALAKKQDAAAVRKKRVAKVVKVDDEEPTSNDGVVGFEVGR